MVHEETDKLRLNPVNEEKDPGGIDQHSGGAKLDADKIRPDLVLGQFANALWAVCEVGTYGAEKYTDNGWLHVPNGVERYTDAMWRHMLKEKIEGPLDVTDSKLPHAAQEAWNALARLELLLRQEKIEKPPFKEVMEGLRKRLQPVQEKKIPAITKKDSLPAYITRLEDDIYSVDYSAFGPNNANFSLCFKPYRTASDALGFTWARSYEDMIAGIGFPSSLDDKTFTWKHIDAIKAILADWERRHP